MAPPFGAKQLRWMRTGAVRRIVARRCSRHVVMERYYNFGGEGMLAAAAARRQNRARSQRAGHRSSRARRRRCIDRALIVEPMRRWRERICARADLIVTPSAAILPRDTPARKIVRARVGRRHERFRPGRSGRAAVRTAGGDRRDLRRRVPQLARRHQSRARDARAARAGPLRHRRGVRRRRTGAAGRAGRSRRPRRTSSSPAPSRTPNARVSGRGRHRRRPVRRSARTGRCRSGSTGRRSRFSSTWPPASPSSHRPSIGFRRSSANGREGILYDPAQPGALADALEPLADPAAPADARPRRAGARRPGVQLEGALRWRWTRRSTARRL